MKGSRVLALAVVASLGGLASVASADSLVVVTSPSGVFTNPTAVNAGDAPATDTWVRTNVRNNGSVGISTTYARSGNASMLMQGTQGPGGASSKADIEYYFSSAPSLSSVTGMGYDWYRDSSSTNDPLQHPSLRLLIDADGNLGTTADRGYLVYEQVYNGVPTAATDAWQTASITGSTNLWSTGGLDSAFAKYDRTLSGWQAFYANATVLGLSSGIGSGWGPFSGAVDNISIGLDGVTTTYNFEQATAAPVPLPAAAWAGMALFGGIGVSKLRRRASNAA